MIRLTCFVLAGFIVTGCSLSPGSLRTLHRNAVVPASERVPADTSEQARKATITYLGAGGVSIALGNEAVLVDPFFSNQSARRIGTSVFFGARNFRSSPKMLEAGFSAIREAGKMPNVLAILNAHAHYDHLMDIPAVYQKLPRKPVLLLPETAFNIIHQTIDSSHVILLENVCSTFEELAKPVTIPRENGAIHVYPILSRHNPHFRNIKFFSGEQSHLQSELVSPMTRTHANLWLEGNTFSFVVDFVDENGTIEFRAFIQSSSCPEPWGFPPPALRNRPVDLACIGVVSFGFSPGYPCALIEAISPRQIMWIHWEDFFRKYTRKPKTVRGTDVPAFFQLPCVSRYKSSSKMLWPRVKMDLVY